MEWGSGVALAAGGSAAAGQRGGVGVRGGPGGRARRGLSAVPPARGVDSSCGRAARASARLARLCPGARIRACPHPVILALPTPEPPLFFCCPSLGGATLPWLRRLSRPHLEEPSSAALCSPELGGPLGQRPGWLMAGSSKARFHGGRAWAIDTGPGLAS